MILTAEQHEVATSSAHVRQLVTAGPGTGKTHTLVARIDHLVEHEDLHPGGVLALSFSRAAVGELTRRLRVAGESTGRVAPVTFDSFATRVLAEIDPDGPWKEQSFDGRIEAATARIEEFGEFLETIEHVCVDELQDLVGVRMRFVRALLERLDTGFTLLGDPAQGIYNFSLADGENAQEHGAPALYSWLRDRYPTELVDRSLTVNHRATSEIAKDAASLGPVVVSDHETAMTRMIGLLSGAPRLGSLGVLRNVRSDERTAILCRNNGHALWVARALREAGIDHVLQRGATNRSVAPWVAQIVQATGGGLLNRDRFARLLATIEPTVDPEAAWLPLRRVCRTDLGIDLDRLVLRLREGNVPDELHVARTAPIVVSTVHRAKGLEFDRVVVLDGGWRAPYDDEDARTFFVALSRTIETLTSADVPDIVGVLSVDQFTDRWIQSGWKRWQRFGIEVKPDDTDRLEPAGSGSLNRDAQAIQRLLVDEVRVGDEVTIEFVRPLIGGLGAFYKIVWQGQDIGMMSEKFGSDLVRVAKTTSKWQYPKRIEGTSIDAIRTIGGDSLVTNQKGLGPGGAWLAPALVGMGRIVWKDD